VSENKIVPSTSITTADLAFPANVLHLMPKMEDIPEEFKDFNGGNIWTKWQSSWFYRGLKEWPKTKPGINVEDAQKHLSCIQGSFQPKHEHKVAAVAYLASLWLEEPKP
jgi:hypothetical protein